MAPPSHNKLQCDNHYDRENIIICWSKYRVHPIMHARNLAATLDFSCFLTTPM